MAGALGAELAGAAEPSFLLSSGFLLMIFSNIGVSRLVSVKSMGLGEVYCQFFLK